MKLKLEVNIELVESFKDNKDKIATIFYPNEINLIQIKKGLNTIEFSEAIYHEIGHLFDWYLSSGNQSNDVNIREHNAEKIGESLRFRNKII
jgi:hypothetical protein